MFKLEENPQEVKVKRPLVTILIVCLFVIAFSFLLFLVSSFHPNPVIWDGSVELARPIPLELGILTTITACMSVG